jgi:outer membrane lipoprotein SlyB
MKRFVAPAAVVLAMVLSSPASGQRRGDVVSVNYGKVTGVKQVQLQSAAAGGAVAGGLVGAVRARGRSGGSRARSAALGAAIGGVGTRILEGSNEAIEYTVRLNESGRDVRVVSEPTGARVGDCVSVEQGRQTNVRRVSSVHCETEDAVPTPAPAPPPAAAPTPVTAPTTTPTEAHIAEATACDQAKQQLLEADEEDALELAIRRIRILCED